MNKDDQDVDYKVNLSNPPVEEQVEENKEEDSVENQETESKEEEVIDQQVEEKKEEVEEEPTPVSKEEMIGEYLTNKYSMGLEDLDNVLSNKNKNTQVLPEEVEKYLKFKDETKRGLKDFVKANEDFSDYDESSLLKEYYRQSNPELDDSDINYLIEDKFALDESVDTDTDKRRKILEKKQELYKAKQYFEQTKEKYNAPLESSMEGIPEEAKEAVQFYQQYNDEKAKEQEVISRQRQSFEEKTSKFFNNDFKGFEFKIGEKTLNFQPKDKQKVVDKQLNLNNFINSFLDDKGVLKDAKKYHTALNMAMNPEAYAKFFYEQGKSDAVNDVVKKGKNIDMNVRSKVDSSKPGAKYRVVESGKGFSSGLRIKKK